MKHFFYLILLFSFSLSSQHKYSTGEIISKVNVKKSNKETFELYLPTKYNQNKKSAIIFIFDPRGIGKLGIKPFISSSEEFNYILISSNNTRNSNLYQKNFDIANRLFAHVFSEFKTDDKQIYLAGFSGGSRLASAIATLTNSIQGVIGCGAGFAFNANIVPSPLSKFSYVGLVGDKDMNYHEMLDLNIMLNKLNIENEVFTYEDGHKWPQKHQINRALSWLELQSFNRGLRKMDSIKIKQLYVKDYLVAKNLEESHPYNSIIEYKRIKRNYTKYYNLDSISYQISVIKNTRTFRKEVKIRKEIKESEFKISNLFLKRFHKESQLSKSYNNYKWWKKELKKLDKKYNKSKSIFTTKMIKRIRYRIMAATVERSNSFLRVKDYKRALYCDSLLVVLKPKMPEAYFRLAQSYARTNKYAKVISNLKKAIELGFNNKNAFLKVAEFSSYQENKDFISLIKSIKLN